MSIRKKILLYFSATVISLLGITLFFIYTLFYEYREEEFQQRQKQKITSTLKLLTETKQADESIIQAMDRLSIYEYYDEKLLIFNNGKEQIYSSIDDTEIPDAKIILSMLSSEHPWIETKDDLYDVIGVYVEHENNAYYGISKAFDVSGYSKLDFLKYVLIFTFLGISLVVILLSRYLSRKITLPITNITQKINNYDFNNAYVPIEVEHSKNEITVLAEQFNELMKRMKEATSFQKHAIHHISHELKTPIAILVSNFERMEELTDLSLLKAQIKNQKEDTKNLSEIINLLVEMSKSNADNVIPTYNLRVDELIFDNLDELSLLFPDFEFSLEYSGHTDDESKLTVSGSSRLLKAALMNLMLNSIHYSDNNEAKIEIFSMQDRLRIDFINEGSVLTKEEQKNLFQHFFRGKNSHGKSGFGLGLFFVSKIITQHHGEISYSVENLNVNIFTIHLPLS